MRRLQSRSERRDVKSQNRECEPSISRLADSIGRYGWLGLCHVRHSCSLVGYACDGTGAAPQLVLYPQGPTVTRLAL